MKNGVKSILLHRRFDHSTNRTADVFGAKVKVREMLPSVDSAFDASLHPTTTSVIVYHGMTRDRVRDYVVPRICNFLPRLRRENSFETGKNSLASCQ